MRPLDALTRPMQMTKVGDGKSADDPTKQAVEVEKVDVVEPTAPAAKANEYDIAERGGPGADQFEELQRYDNRQVQRWIAKQQAALENANEMLDFNSPRYLGERPSAKMQEIITNGAMDQVAHLSRGIAIARELLVRRAGGIK